ncbi:MAG: UDP-N-acetylglucosamine 2-epimerase (hydrolyzing) [Planctomycetes bacterium]|nr:UDP-N-acetylglucosamine 2-epimerase (hydrolyzing) [Planctomycetota bacterium]
MITGTRAEFGTLEPVLKAIARRGQLARAVPLGVARLDSRLIVTGMHLLAKFGRTIDEIRGKGYRIDETVRMQTGRDDAVAQAAAVARGVDGIAAALDRLGCDIVLVLGDRIEAFAGACAGAITRRVVAHSHGGDRAPGDIDEPLRNAITRLAHVHLAASRDAARRLMRMGEPQERIHVVGAPGLDAIRDFRRAERRSPGRTSRRLAELIGTVAEQRYAVLVQHPCGRDPETEASVTRRAIGAIERAGLAGVAIWPNSDPGHDGIIRELGRLTGRPAWRVFRSLVREDYLRLVHRSAVLVGNSSSGIIESASLGVCAVNIGGRQAGRLRCGSSVIEVDETASAIQRAITSALARRRPDPGKSVYGDGRAGERIARILSKVRVDDATLRKVLSY